MPTLSFRTGFSSQVGLIYVFLLAFNVTVWAAALMLFHDQPVQLGAAVIAYGLGLRHAVDADHIAAIDSATRKLMHEGRRAADVGLFFSLGHSTVVVLLTVGLVITASAVHPYLPAFAEVGGAVGLTVSTLFLLVLGITNFLVCIGLWRTYRELQNSGVYEGGELAHLPGRGGPLSRLFRKLFRFVNRSWHMYPIGLLFGLGFDTATAIGLLVLSVSSAEHGVALWSVMVYPALFTAAMSLVDTTDSVVMTRAYRWALDDPKRRLVYNMSITALSAMVALIVSGVQAAGVFGAEFDVSEAVGRGLNLSADRFGDLFGYSIIAAFLVCWATSMLLYRSRKRQ